MLDLLFEILIDSREKKPYSFSSITPPPATHICTLKTGDYSLSNLSDEVTIERKSLSDLYSTLGRGRKRFIRELERMQRYNYAAVIIESSWLGIIRNPPPRSRLNPKTIYASIVAWQIRYNIHFWTVPNRAFGEKTTYRLLDRYFRDHKKDVADGKNA